MHADVYADASAHPATAPMEDAVSVAAKAGVAADAEATAAAAAAAAKGKAAAAAAPSRRVTRSSKRRQVGFLNPATLFLLSSSLRYVVAFLHMPLSHNGMRRVPGAVKRVEGI